MKFYRSTWASNVTKCLCSQLSCINLNIETSSFFITGGPYVREKFHFSEVRLCGKLGVNFHSATVRLLAKFELPEYKANLKDTVPDFGY